MYTNEEINKIYRTADDISKRIIEDFADECAGMKDLFLKENYGQQLVFKDIISVKSHRTKLKKTIMEDCLAMDYLYFSPIFIEVLSKYYENKNENSPTLLGLALKNTLNFIWAGSYNSMAKDSRSYSSLKLIITKSVLYILLEQIIKVWELKDLEEVCLSDSGFVGSDEFINFSRILSLQGRHEYKVLEQATQYIWENEGIDFTLECIISGVAKTKEAFQGSFLADIPSSDAKFWVKLWTLRKLMGIAKHRNQLFSRDLLGLSLIPQGMIPSNSTFPRQVLQEIVYNCFWRPDWHIDKVSKDLHILQTLILERPCIRVRDTDHLFATSIFLLMDAINYCLESYVHKNDVLYEKHFTKAFEEQVTRLLVRYHFKCGEVSERGTWKTSEGQIQLDNSSRMPGQIDILALSPSGKQGLLIDCKLIHFPSTSAALRNLISKFDDRDTESFHKKLKNKRKWLKGCTLLKNAEITNVHITNIHIPLQGSEKAVFSYGQLENLLEENFGLPAKN